MAAPHAAPGKHVLGWRRLHARQRVYSLWFAAMLLRVWSGLDDAPRGGSTAGPAGTPG